MTQRNLIILMLVVVLVAVGATYVMRAPAVTPPPSTAQPTTQRPASDRATILGEDNALVEGGVATSEHYILISSPTNAPKQGAPSIK